MSNYNGYLLKSTKTNQIFPMKYIKYDSWESDPNHREDIKAYRDDNTRALYRETVKLQYTKSAFSFSTRDNLTLEDREAIKQFFDSAYSDATERKLSLEYWNDEDLNYKTGVFYVANMQPKIKVVKGDTLVYNSYKIEFVEY